MAKKKLTRKQLLKEPDEFITLTGRVVAWAKENTRQLAIGGGALLGFVLVVAIFSMVQDRRAATAEAILSQAISAYQTASADDQKSVALETVSADFERLFGDYSSLPAGRLGQIVYGHYCLAAAAFDKAIAHYESALGHFKNDLSLSNVILNGLGSAYQQKGELAQAVTYYKQIVAGANPMLKDAALFNLGRLHERLGDTAEQQKVIQQLADDFPTSFYTNLVREKIGS